MSIESQADLVGMQRVGRTVALVLQEMRATVRVGMTTADLDGIAAVAMKRYGARSAPRMTYGFPGYTCISVNDEIVHGIPGDRRLRSGDVLKIDVTAEQSGYVADAARTIVLGAASRAVVRLRDSAIASLNAALAAAHAGKPVSAIGRAVEDRARRDGFAVIRELCGHGVGRAIHEMPNVPNYEDSSSRAVLSDGLVIAIEPATGSALDIPRSSWLVASVSWRAPRAEDRYAAQTHRGQRVQNPRWAA